MWRRAPARTRSGWVTVTLMGDTHVQKLETGRFIRAVWVPGAGLWYYVEAERPEVVTAPTLEQLAGFEDVRTYATREEAERAARMVP